MITIRRVAFVRNIMVGREGLSRERLLDCFAEAGARDARSHISTGNVTFFADDARAVADGAEAAIARIIGRTEEVFVRDLRFLRRLHRLEPFDGLQDVHERVVSFGMRPFRISEPLPLRTSRGDAAYFRVFGRQAFGYSRMVEGRTQSPAGLLERVAGQPITTRSWGTIEKILSKESG
ncbi:MAG: DUF1697 domain-containing protein [Acidimicrobiia bacterium]|nr:DUF1697 domain-containing protein [Acidimicrobiia bacterium]NNF10865.1 DUF1697 domain-containing protein [Acidimicrobiia bacterium]NNL71237.1 DUF1697 domain-containing protein [Acidimicrobiia bacterium]